MYQFGVLSPWIKTKKTLPVLLVTFTECLVLNLISLFLALVASTITLKMVLIGNVLETWKSVLSLGYRRNNFSVQQRGLNIYFLTLFFITIVFHSENVSFCVYTESKTDSDIIRFHWKENFSTNHIHIVRIYIWLGLLNKGDPNKFTQTHVE